MASAGQNGQFRTSRHIIKLMVEMMAPKPSDTICDPACGTAGFLVAASEYLQKHHQQDIYADTESARRFNHDTFHGFDFDSTMLRVGSMNMLLHGVENPAIENRDSLSQGHAGVEGQFSLILANPPFWRLHRLNRVSPGNQASTGAGPKSSASEATARLSTNLPFKCFPSAPIYFDPHGDLFSNLRSHPPGAVRQPCRNGRRAC